MFTEYMTVAEAAAFINRTEAAIYRMVARRQIPYRKYGRKLIFKRTELQQHLERLPGVSLEEVMAQASAR